MRELKFRVWTGMAMEYRVVVGQLGAFYVEGLDPKDSACMSPFNTIYDKATPVMQFTGLKDKNGKEIYEGDILKSPHAVNTTFIVTWEAKEARFVAWGKGIGIAPGAWHKREVIGNIYEQAQA